MTQDIAGGGEAGSDIEHLRAQPVRFGQVASAPTLYRTIRSLTPMVVDDLWARIGQVRSQVWARHRRIGG